MASVTQTIPQFTGGISEQPDHLKFPGQVKDIVNGIPDVTKGLFKRPGAERKKTTPLSDVQSGGSWFHYYRDETEGSYIGQVAADGQVRVWRCNDGQLMTTAYGTGGQTVIQNYLATTTPENLQFLTINDTTFVSNRDSTNANTAVGTANTTTARPHIHFAFVELLRTENGRQYALNISDTTETASLSRATRISIESDTLDESDGTGHCPGIGTQVFSVTAANSYAGTNIVSVKNGNTDLTSGKDNLIFRINTLGQQGVSPDYNANSSGAGGDNYRCSYNREAVLLHGGEGWVTGDTVTVTLTSASGGGPMRNKWNTNNSYNTNDLVRNNGNTYRAIQNLDDTVGEPVHNSGIANLWEFVSDTDSPAATYTIKVLEHETTQVQARINSTDKGLIRPAPTPFDADTAVTADTILGGIKAQIDNINPSNPPITVEIIGTGMYLYSSSAFNLEVVEEDLMRCFQETVNDVTRLPNQCKHGLIVEVSNSQRADEDDYYLRFNGQGLRSGVGSWIECAKPGIAKDLTNMPLVIQRTGTTTFTVKQFTYEFRRVGDENTNPLPSFVKTSDGLPKSDSNTFVGRINKVLFFRNRLAFLSGENVILSRPGTLGEPDFFAETALTVSASDPIDISASSMFPSELFDGIEINTGLLVFSTNQQFLLSSDDTVLNPDTAKLRSVSTFNYNKDIAPISLGTTVAYVDNSGKFSRFNEMANIRCEGEPNVVEVSKVVPSLLPKNIDLITNSRENSIVLLGNTGSKKVFGYKYLNVGEKRQQAAWFKWQFNQSLLYHFIIDDEYFFLDSEHFLQCIKLVQQETDPNLTKDNVNFLLHLDNYTSISGGVVSTTPDTSTTFSNLGWLGNTSTPTSKLAVIDENGKYAKVSGADSTRITVPGDWTGSNSITLGYLYDYKVDFPTLYPTKTSGNSTSADVNASLVIHRIKLHFGRSGVYETTLTRLGKDDYTELHESNMLDDYTFGSAAFLSESIKTVPIYERNLNIDITLKSTHPAPATLRALSWEGDYSPRFYQRV